MIPQSNRVYCVKCPEASYVTRVSEPAPELPGGRTSDVAEWAVRSLCAQASLDRTHYGSPDWNPLGDLIRRGDKVLIKPNWVTHRNGSGHGLDCLVTHTSVIAAILTYVSKAQPGHIVVGDAPIQGCDFRALREACQIDALARGFAASGIGFAIRDFRRTILDGGVSSHGSRPSDRGQEDYVLFDLKTDSDLEPISDGQGRFRVTMYDPERLQQTHRPGRHQYLVAREAIEADVVINVPKLKTHKKAGLTGALKNLVGINGLKDYLPHHRKGGSLQGGDCYEGRSRLKSFNESMLDAANGSRWPAIRPAFAGGYRLGRRLGQSLGIDGDLEGSWYGNDTVWRMCLDLQRILHYGRIDGGMGDQMQRRVLTITDAIVAGEGNGPMSPSPVSLGMMTFGMNTCALDWVHARLIRFDPRRIPLIREAFARNRYPLADFEPDEIDIEVEGRRVEPSELAEKFGQPFRAPSGWMDHCEFAERR